ncbi:MAG: tryptophan 2,3-dioxygenase [Rhizobiaceae bacterium]
MNASTPYDPENEGAQMKFDDRMSYSDYLGLDTLLRAQKPLTQTHDEMLFIIQHQTSELWMKLILHEVNVARQAIGEGRMSMAFKNLSRVAKIFEQLNNAWDVLRTMTPSEYTAFRDDLGQSSGFQSWQYRLIEYVVGNRNPAMLKPHEHEAEIIDRLRAELKVPSLYDVVICALSDQGLEISTKCLERDISKTHEFDDSVQEAWRKVYSDPQSYWELYELAEKLVDLEDYFRRWRFNHVTTVERVIGFKRGTGGTGGVSYLKRMLEVELFPELWRVRTIL